MTTRLDSLRVGAEFDAGAYNTGAAQKVAADQSMVTSMRAVGVAATQTDSKISASGDVLTRLSKQYVDGYSNALKFQTAVNQLARGVDAGKISITQTGPILDGIYKKYGQTADAATFLKNGQAELALAVTAANTRFTQAKPAVEGHASAMSIGNTQAMALTHSMRSFVEQMAMGIPVTQAAVGQVNYLSYALAGEDGLLAALKKAGPGLLSAFATPGVGVGIGIAAALVGVAGYAIATKESVKSADDVLKDHAENIRALKDAYGTAADAALNYGKAAANEGRIGIAIPTAMTELELRLSLANEARTSSNSLIANDNGLAGGSQMGPAINSNFKDFSAEIEAYRSSIAKGTPDVLAFRKAVTEKWDLNRNDEELTKEAAAIFKLTDAAAALQLAMPGAKAALDTLNNGRFPSVADAREAQDYRDQNAADLYQLQQQQDATLLGIGARSPEERRRAAMAAERAKGGDDSAEVGDFKAQTAGAVAYAQAVHQITEANNQRAAALSQYVDSNDLGDLFGDSA